VKPSTTGDLQTVYMQSGSLSKTTILKASRFMVWCFFPLFIKS